MARTPSGKPDPYAQPAGKPSELTPRASRGAVRASYDVTTATFSPAPAAQYVFIACNHS